MSLNFGGISGAIRCGERECQAKLRGTALDGALGVAVDEAPLEDEVQHAIGPMTMRLAAEQA